MSSPSSTGTALIRTDDPEQYRAASLVLAATGGVHDPKALLTVYNPDTGAAAARAGLEMYIPGKRPTLAQVETVYGRVTAGDFMQLHLTAAIRRNAQVLPDTPTERQRADIRALAESMAEACRHWMLSEIVVFFEKLSNGDYGELTRTLTRQQLFTRLRAFDAHRREMRHRALQKMKEADTEAVEAIMRELYPAYAEEAGAYYDLAELRRRAWAVFAERNGRAPVQ